MCINRLSGRRSAKMLRVEWKWILALSCRSAFREGYKRHGFSGIGSWCICVGCPQRRHATSKDRVIKVNVRIWSVKGVWTKPETDMKRNHDLSSAALVCKISLSVTSSAELVPLCSGRQPSDENDQLRRFDRYCNLIDIATVLVPCLV